MCRTLTLSLLLGGLGLFSSFLRADDIHVLVWDERQPQQQQAYPQFLGTAIANHLSQKSGIDIRSRNIDDADQGLSQKDLDWADVLVWWGHVRQHEIKREFAKKEIIERIKRGDLSLIALHSAHWSTPFVEAMNERTRQDLFKLYPPDKTEFEFVDPPGRLPPAHGSRLTPSAYVLKTSPDRFRIRVDLPNCCFPDYRPDGAPSRVEVLMPKHPIAQGLGKSFPVQHTEMYNEPFHVPEPDEVIFKETWEKGEWFRAGMVWNIGKGKVFYFRPGHETFPVYQQREPLQVLENAVRYLASPSP
jgi:trehalose utilization protein